MIHSIIVRCTRFSSVFLVSMLDSSSCVCVCDGASAWQKHTFAALNWRLRHKIELDRMQFSKHAFHVPALTLRGILHSGIRESLPYMCYIASIHWWHLRFTCKINYTEKSRERRNWCISAGLGFFGGNWGELFFWEPFGVGGLSLCFTFALHDLFSRFQSTDLPRSGALWPEMHTSKVLSKPYFRVNGLFHWKSLAFRIFIRYDAGMSHAIFIEINWICS